MACVLPRPSPAVVIGTLALLLVLVLSHPVMGIELSFGDAAEGSIEAPGSTDEYTFSVEAGDEIFVRVHTSSETLTALSNEINATSGATTTSLNNAHGLELARVLHVTTPGTCSVVVGASYDQTGDYSVYVQRLNDPVGSQPLGFGTTTNGSITTSADMSTYAFSAAEQDVIKAWMAGDWNDVGKYEFLYLFRTDGMLVTQSDTWGYYGDLGSGWGSTGAITATLPSSSGYVLLAGGDGSKWANDSGTFDLFAQRVNNPGNAVALEYGRTIEGSIDNVLAWKTYASPLNAGDTVFIRLSQNTAQSRYESLQVFGPDGAELTGQATEGDIARILHATQTGTYTFILGSVWGPTQTGGGYSLFVQRLNNPANSQPPLTFGTAQTATIATNGEMDTYTISGSEQDVLTVLLNGDWTGSSKGNLLYLYRDDGVLVAQSKIDSWLGSEGAGWTARGYLSTRLPSTAQYVLLAGGAGSDWAITGTYQVYAQWTNRPANATQIAFGDHIAGTLSTPAQVDAYTFTAQQGDPVYFALASSIGVKRWLYAPNGTEMDLGPESWRLGVAVKAPETGTYTIIVADDGGDQKTGDYGLYLQRLASPMNTTPIEFGQSTAQSFDHIGQVDAYSFSADAGDVLVGRAGSLQLRPVIQIYDPSGTLLGRVDDQNTPNLEDFSLRLPVTGTYTILVSEIFGWYTGGYGLAIQPVNHPGATVGIGFEETVAGTFNTSAEIDTYVFAAQKGDLLHAASESQFSDNNFALLRFYSPNGTLLGASAAYSSWQDLSVTAPEAGTYSLLVVGGSGGGTGPYTLELWNERPVQMLAGKSYRGNLSADSLTPWDYYYLDTSAGEDLAVQVVPDTASAELELYGSLNSIPTTATYDFSQNGKTVGGMYELLISPTMNGTYWFGIRAKAGSTGYTIRALSGGGNYLSNIYPTVVDNSVEARIQIYGLGFVPGMHASLTSNGTTIATAGSTILASTTMVVATFDLKAVPLGTYDVVLEWPDHSTRAIPSVIQVRSLPGGVRYLNKGFAVESGQTVTVPYNLIDSPRNLFVTLQKIEYGGDPHVNWDGTLTVLRDGVAAGTDSGYQDQMVHLVNPSPGSYTISVKAESEVGHAILTVWDELPVLTPDQWVVDRVLRPYGSVYHQIELSPGQKTLQFDAQAMGDLSRFMVYNGQWMKGQAWLSSSGPSASLTIDNPPSGLYVVEFQDTQMVTGSEQARDVMLQASTTDTFEPPPGYLPAIASISPTKGGNTGNVTIEVKGAWLNNYSSVTLVRAGYPDITAAAVIEDGSGTELMAKFNLMGQVSGAWDLTVSKQDGQIVAAPFIIMEGGEPDVYLELLGRNTVRWGSPVPVYLTVHNSGLIDAEGVEWVITVQNITKSMDSAITNFQVSDEVMVSLSEASGSGVQSYNEGNNYNQQDIRSGSDYTSKGQIDPLNPNPWPNKVNCWVVLPSTPTVKNKPKKPPVQNININRIVIPSTTFNYRNTSCDTCPITANCGLNGAILNQASSSGGFETCGGGSVDPEDKYGIAGYGPASHFVQNDNPLSYRVEFWNAENATANVMDVQAYDQLDSNLNIATFGFSEVGFTNWRVPLDGAPSFDVYVDTRPSMPYIVHVIGDMDPATGKVTLEYHTLDATTLQPPEDTVAGFLPPIATNEIGWFAYSVSPRANLPTGTVIENQAFVNFDYTQYFPAPPDAPWRNTLDAGAPTTRVNATLANSTEIRFALTGTDDTGGSGIQDYTIYASDNGGAFEPFLADIAGTSAVALGETNHTYRFFSIGRDNVGNVEGMKSAPEATVTVTGAVPTVVALPGCPSVPRDLNGDGRYEDINGNGRKDFADVVLYFNHMAWIVANEPAGALDFDYNENDRIDFADVVWLFNHL